MVSQQMAQWSSIPASSSVVAIGNLKNRCMDMRKIGSEKPLFQYQCLQGFPTWFKGFKGFQSL